MQMLYIHAVVSWEKMIVFEGNIIIVTLFNGTEVNIVIEYYKFK